MAVENGDIGIIGSRPEVGDESPVAGGIVCQAFRGTGIGD